MDIPKELKEEVWNYCRVNDISNIDDFIIQMVKQGFTVEKFGSTPYTKEPEVVEKEKIVEVIKEVPVEKIVEVIKEVPVEKIVEKEVYITDDVEVSELSDKITVLEEKNSELNDELESERKKFSTKTVEMENNFQQELDKVRRKLDDTSKDDKVKELTEDVESEKLKNKKLKEELDEVRRKLDIKINQEPRTDDMYGEGKGGFFGSNLSD